MANNSKLISIYIPTKNRKDSLEEAIESCLMQTYKNIEIVIVDDNSDDETSTIAMQYKKRNPNIAYYHLPKSKGAAFARNLAVRRSNGFFVTGLDDDDLFQPFRLEDFVKKYNVKWSFLCSSAVECTEPFEIKSIEKDRIISLSDISRRNCVGNQIFIERSRFIRSGGFDLTFKSWQDYELWYRLIRRYGSALKLGNNSIKIRTDQTNRISNSITAGAGYLQFIKKHGDKLSIADIKAQKANDLINQRKKMSFFGTLIECYSTGVYLRLLKLYLRTNYPTIYTWVSHKITKSSKI